MGNIRHSPIGWVARQIIHFYFQLAHGRKESLSYQLPGGTSIKLHPEGEMAEFLCIPGLFESTEMQWVANFLKPGMKVIDIGANVGLYSVLAASLIGENGRVWAFEPSKETFNRLKRNLELNNCSVVVALELALTNESDAAKYLVSDAGYGDVYRYLASSPDSKSPNAELIQTTTLDAFVQEHNIDNIDLIKIDVEGGEYKVLLGSLKVLADNKKVTIMFENEADWCERAGCTQHDCLNLLRENGFNLFTWDKSKQAWSRDQSELLRSTMIWATRDDEPVSAKEKLD